MSARYIEQGEINFHPLTEHTPTRRVDEGLFSVDNRSGMTRVEGLNPSDVYVYKVTTAGTPRNLLNATSALPTLRSRGAFTQADEPAYASESE